MANRLDVEKRLHSFPDRAFAGGVGVESIDAAQADFEGEFPADFVEFLRTLGSGYVSSEEFIGLGSEPHLNISTVANQLRHNSTTLGRFLPSLVPVGGDGFGNFDCIDLAGSDALHSRIISWVHGVGPQEPEIIAQSYWDWFDGILDMITKLDSES